MMEKKVRLAKIIAESGVASRREAERLIEAGRVAVDDIIVRTPVFFADDQNRITVDGKVIPGKAREICIWKFYKPIGVITSKRDHLNRKTVFDFLEEYFKKKGQTEEDNRRVIYIGRLDCNSEGLLLFTNSGELARKAELPATGLKRTYKVRLYGKFPEDAPEKLKRGICIAGVRYGPVAIRTEKDKKDPVSRELSGPHKRLSSSNPANTKITVVLREGKNREIRKITEYFGCKVNKLVRTEYGPIEIGKMYPGEILLANPEETEKFLAAVGIGKNRTDTLIR
jgi:23S rRNA pseudouridine2605 synthase